MTIAIALQINDGVVLASDSAITMQDPNKSAPDNITNVYGNGNKIFNIIKGYPVGGVFYGTANFGSFSIPTLVKDVRRRLSGKDNSFQKWKIKENNYTIEEIAKRVREYLFDENYATLSPQPKNQQFGFILAGYGSGQQLSETWSIEISNGVCPAPKLVMGKGDSNMYAGGDPDALFRIVNGYSPKLSAALIQEGIDGTTVGKVKSAADKHLPLSLVESAMPIQDAIGLAEFFVETTGRLAHFKRGFATVGGPTESAAITKHEGFRWVKRKHYFASELNPGVPYDRA